MNLKVNYSGFSLIELMVIVIIIGLLSVFAIPMFTGYVNDSKVSKVKADLANYILAIKRYEIDYGIVPFEINELEGYYISKMTKDPWGNDYFIDIKRGAILSFGSDGVYSEDDILHYYEPKGLFPIDAWIKDCGKGNKGKLGNGDKLVIKFSKFMISHIKDGIAYPLSYHFEPDIQFYTKLDDGEMVNKLAYTYKEFNGNASGFKNVNIFQKWFNTWLYFMEGFEKSKWNDPLYIEDDDGAKLRSFHFPPFYFETNKESINYIKKRPKEFVYKGILESNFYSKMISSEMKCNNFSKKIIIPIFKDSEYSNFYFDRYISFLLKPKGNTYLNTRHYRNDLDGDFKSLASEKAFSGAICDLEGNVCIESSTPVLVRWED